MKISVVTISFNQAEFIEDTINSVLNQKNIDIEYIIVDPGSTDGSRDIIDKYADKIIRLYEKDAGAADGLNKGFAKATGDIFCYINSDDLLEPNCLEYIVGLFEKNKSIEVVYGDCHIINESGDKVRRCFSDRFNLRAAAYGSSIVIQPSTFFKKETYLSVGGFNSNNKSNWDGELFIDMALNGHKMVKINKILSSYRVHSQSITGSGNLHELHLKHSDNMFHKIMKRDRNGFDKYLSIWYRVLKHLTHPVATFERITKGPIFGASK